LDVKTSELALSAPEAAGEDNVAAAASTAMPQQQLEVASVPSNACYLSDGNLGRIYIHNRRGCFGEEID